MIAITTGDALAFRHFSAFLSVLDLNFSLFVNLAFSLSNLSFSSSADKIWAFAKLSTAMAKNTFKSVSVGWLGKQHSKAEFKVRQITLDGIVYFFTSLSKSILIAKDTISQNYQ